MGLAAQKKIYFTYKDLLLFPEGERYEIIDGELFMTPSPYWSHQSISSNLFRLLDSFISKKKLGLLRYAPMDIIFSETNVVQPDLLFISSDRKHLIKERGIFGAPNLLIEILSKGTSSRDRILKRKLYAQFKVEEYWIVDPKTKTIELIGWKDSEFITLQIFKERSEFKSFLLKGLKFKTAEAFKEY